MGQNSRRCHEEDPLGAICSGSCIKLHVSTRRLWAVVQNGMSGCQIAYVRTFKSASSAQTQQPLSCLSFIEGVRDSFLQGAAGKGHRRDVLAREGGL